MIQDMSCQPQASFSVFPQLLMTVQIQTMIFDEQHSLGKSMFQDPQPNWQKAHKTMYSIQEEESIFDHLQKESSLQPIPDPIPPKPKPNNGDYQKNVGAYQGKNALQAMLSFNHRRKVQKLCNKYSCSYRQLCDFFNPKLKQVFGINYILSLLASNDKAQRSFKRVFNKFYTWYLRNVYMRYILNDGKMTDPESYIRIKNAYMLNLAHQAERLSM